MNNIKKRTLLKYADIGTTLLVNASSLARITREKAEHTSFENMALKGRGESV